MVNVFLILHFLGALNIKQNWWILQMLGWSKSAYVILDRATKQVEVDWVIERMAGFCDDDYDPPLSIGNSWPV
jgi:hypothetical protein